MRHMTYAMRPRTKVQQAMTGCRTLPRICRDRS
jgi:hypothetical protein